MRRRRGLADERLLCSGPGRLGAGARHHAAHNGLRAGPAAVRIARAAQDDASRSPSGPRIGITKAADVPWRFGLKGSRFLSKPFRER